MSADPLTRGQYLNFVWVRFLMSVLVFVSRDLQNIRDPRKNYRSFVDEKLRALHRPNLNK